MTKQTKTNLLLTILLFGVFAIFTVLVKTVDVQAIGPEGSSVGFATLNGAIAQALPFNEFWYKITKILGVTPFLAAAFFGLLGLLQLIQGKSLKAVDADIYALAISYAATVVFYVFFEKVIINYRPIIKDVEEGLEASYPSSHTLLIIAIIGTALIEISNRIKDEKVCLIVRIVLALIIVVTVIGRLISGVHWFTDIVAGMILGATIISLFLFLEGLFRDKNSSQR